MAAVLTGSGDHTFILSLHEADKPSIPSDLSTEIRKLLARIRANGGTPADLKAKSGCQRENTWRLGSGSVREGLTVEGSGPVQGQFSTESLSWFGP
ncbi:hypothetical protein N7510_000353 [Penicillium lagena]|uniref:uncharacterized protein n=1 Tax=Penicillium lagena TaxID=94218 RepID=UPI002541D498|nr:uncharacterized protein N7510_000353 [Penicillium lagena]KAJ5624044.1 hypothetical protein N7510_000353 [Penicillium lagena]